MKQDKKELSMDKQAKMDMLKALRNMAMEMINSSGESEDEAMQKVTVAAKDKEGLEEGLSKAQDILEARDEAEEDEEMSSEDEIAALEAKLAALKAKKLKA